VDLKDQRDRFLAFSFAAADLSLELDAEHTISYAIGAGGHIFGCDVEHLKSKSFLSLFADTEARIIGQIVDTLRPGARFGSLLLHTTETTESGPDTESNSDQIPPTIAVSGYKMPAGNDHIYVSVSAINRASFTSGSQNRRDVETQLLEQDSFTSVVKETLKLSQQTGQDLTLTLINIPSSESLREAWGEERTLSFLSYVGALLRAYSVNDGSFRFGANSYAVLHGRDADSDQINELLIETSKQQSPDQQPLVISSNSLKIEHALSEGDKLRALLYIVTDFMDDPEKVSNVQSMGQAIDRMLRETGEKIQRFRAAIESQSIELYVQPIMNFGSLEIDHYEALVRFDGNKSPTDLIQFAEGVGIVHDLDFAVCENAIQYILDHPTEQVRLSVNLSGQSLLSSIFNTRLVALLNRHKIDRSRLIFEITDSANLADLDRANEALQVLRKMGHPVSLDGFKVDFDALKYLYLLEIDYLKFSGETILQMLNQRRKSMMLKAICGLSADLDVRTIATLVEARGQIDFLMAQGMELGQGFYFGKPLPLPTIALNGKYHYQNSKTYGRR